MAIIRIRIGYIATNVLTPGDCTADQFFCDASCLNRSVRCNGHIDCSDHSDEMDCSSHSYPGSGSSHLYPVGLPCPQHKCPSGRCYSESERCDRRNHCEDGSDEANCKSFVTITSLLHGKDIVPGKDLFFGGLLFTLS